MENEGNSSETRHPLQTLKHLSESYISTTIPTSQNNAKPCNDLRDGKTLSQSLKGQFNPKTMACVPMEELDSAYQQRTFLVFGKRGTIHRFSAENSLFLLHPLNPLRKLALFIITHYGFSAFIVATVLFNVYALANYMDYTLDYICIVIYFLEFNLKVLGQGLFIGEFTCLRNPWNCLDILAILTSLLGSFNWDFIRVLKWLRLLKIVPLTNVLRNEFIILYNSIRQLMWPLFYSFVSIFLLSGLGLFGFMGVLTQKCISNLTTSATYEEWVEHNQIPENWEKDDQMEAILCGNLSGQHCKAGYTCLEGFGSNPHYGYTQFDSFLWSLFQTYYRIVPQDFLEDIFQKTIATTGAFSSIYYIISFFIGTFAIGAFSQGQVAQYLFQEFGHDFPKTDRQPEDSEANNEEQPRREIDSQSNKLKIYCKQIANHYGFEMFITLIIFFDVITHILDMGYRWDDAHVLTKWVFHLNWFIVFFAYLVELCIKVIGNGPLNHFKNSWNVFDAVILVLLLWSFLWSSSTFILPPFRLLKIVPRWTKLNNLLKIMFQTLTQFSGSFGLLLTFWLLIALILNEYGDKYVEHGWKFPNANIPRWHSIDLWHSFMKVFRSWALKENLEMLWDCMLVVGKPCLVIYPLMQLSGSLLIMLITIRIVFITMFKLESLEVEGPEKKSTLRKMFEFFQRPITILLEKIIPKKVGPELIPMKGDVVDLDSSGGTEHVEESTKEGDISKISGIREKMKIFAEGKILWIVSVTIIILSSYIMGLKKGDLADWNENLTTLNFLMDIVFIIFFTALLLYNGVCHGFKWCIQSFSWIMDAIIVLDCILNMEFKFSSKFGFIHSSRLLMLVSRFDGLKAVVSGIFEQFKIMWSYIVPSSYIWLCFAYFFHISYTRGLYRCFDVMSGSEENKFSFNEEECLFTNNSWISPNLKFDNALDSFLTISMMLATRNGWPTFIIDTFDIHPTGHPSKDHAMIISGINIILFYIFGVLLLFGILLGVAVHHLRSTKGTFFTRVEYCKYLELRESNPSTNNATFSRPESFVIRGKIFYFVTSNMFDWIVMGFVLGTFILAFMEHYQASETNSIIFNALDSILILFYLIEVVLKMIGLGKNYFTSGWNRFDLFALSLSVLGLVMKLFIEYNFYPVYYSIILRLFRILKLFHFRPLMSRALDLKIFYRTIVSVKSALTNLLFMQGILMFSYMVYGVSVFGYTKPRGYLVNNFSNLRSAFFSLFLLSSSSGVERTYFILASEYDCQLPEEGKSGDCGDKVIATIYVFSYLFISFLIFLNFYLVFILELVAQKTKPKPNKRPTADLPIE